MAERRSPVMIVVDAWWEGEDGALQKGRARIVNKSVSGACVRVEKRIHVGAKLRIESRWDEFCGVAKYCRSDGRGYLVGMRRETGVGSIPKQAAKRLLSRDDRQGQETTLEEPQAPDGMDGQRREQIPPERRVPETVANRDEPVGRENLMDDPLKGEHLKDGHLAGEQLTGEKRVESTGVAEIGASGPPNEAAAEMAVEEAAPRVGDSKWSRRRWHSSQDRGVRSQQWWEALGMLLLKEKEAPKERGSRPMGINWMGRGKRGAEDAKENGNASSGGAGERNKPVGTGSGDTAERNRAVAPVVAAQPIKEHGAAAVEGDLSCQSELLPLEEIYSAAGIVSPRRGYTIKKVVEMLHSEHLGGLSKEMRRASVMMALDAAGVSVDEVLRDARLRLEAIKVHEEDQKQLCEAEWGRKAEEHGQLKAELEQVRGRFMERMKQTLDAIARDRERFGTWLTEMHEEAKSIAEAAELCLKATAPAPPPVLPAVPDNVVAIIAPKADEAKETALKVV
jgi:hypothetical protein